MGLLQELAVIETWGVIAATTVCGAVGSLVHRFAEDEPEQVWWKVASIGIVAAIGLVSITPPSTGLQLIGLALLGGFFARTVLVALESRLALALARQKTDRALGIAGEAIELSRRGRVAPASEADLGRLSARLDEVKSFGTRES